MRLWPPNRPRRASLLCQTSHPARWLSHKSRWHHYRCLHFLQFHHTPHNRALHCGITETPVVMCGAHTMMLLWRRGSLLATFPSKLKFDGNVIRSSRVSVGFLLFSFSRPNNRKEIEYLWGVRKRAFWLFFVWKIQRLFSRKSIMRLLFHANRRPDATVMESFLLHHLPVPFSLNWIVFVLGEEDRRALPFKMVVATTPVW